MTFANSKQKHLAVSAGLPSYPHQLDLLFLPLSISKRSFLVFLGHYDQACYLLQHNPAHPECDRGSGGTYVLRELHK